MASRRRRQKDAYALLTKHIPQCVEHLKYIQANHFQDGQAAYDYMVAACAAPLNAVKIRELRRQWDDMDLALPLHAHIYGQLPFERALDDARPPTCRHAVLC